MTAGPGELTLELRRVMPARREVVFAAFTDPEVLATWWGPEGFSVPAVDLRAVAGAPYRIEMQPPGADAFFLTGTFRDVDPPAHLAFTFAWEPPDPDDAENVVSLDFRELGDATEVRYAQGPFRTEARRALHRDGWTDSFDRLERLLRDGG